MNALVNLTDSQRQEIINMMFEPLTMPSDLMIDLVTKLFLKFKDRYRNTMSTGGQIDWGRNKIIEWADYFTAKNATIDELRQAYILAKDNFPTFPPNEVEFLNQVRVKRHLTVEQALKIAAECASLSQYETVKAEKWVNGAIYETATRIGFYTLTHEPLSVVKNSFKTAYKAVCEEIDMGAVYNVPNVPLIEKKHTVAPSEVANKYLAQMMGKTQKN